MVSTFPVNSSYVLKRGAPAGLLPLLPGTMVIVLSTCVLYLEHSRLSDQVQGDTRVETQKCGDDVCVTRVHKS